MAGSRLDPVAPVAVTRDSLDPQRGCPSVAWPRRVGSRGRASARLALGALLAASLVGCARYQNVNIRSEPAGAQIFLDGREIGRTPLRVRIDRDKDHVVFLKLDGHVPEREVLTLNRVPDRIDFLTPADVELRLLRRVGNDPAADSSRDVQIEAEEGSEAP